MEYNIRSLFLETTRRCNLCCDHCMRGDAQNLDLTKELIDELFDKLKGVNITTLVFTGGEPTLNPDIIVYTINKIMDENISVGFIQMISNGQEFNRDIARAFDRYNVYYLRKLGLYDPLFRSRHAVIAFSRDEHHDPMDAKVKEQYRKYAPHTSVVNHIVPERRILKTGRATYGKEFQYKLKNLPYQIDPNQRELFLERDLYLSATGLINNSPDGSYEDMDNINFGSVYDFSLEKLLCEQGFPVGQSANLNDLLGRGRIMTQRVTEQ